MIKEYHSNVFDQCSVSILLKKEPMTECSSKYATDAKLCLNGLHSDQNSKQCVKLRFLETSKQKFLSFSFALLPLSKNA